MYVKKYIYIIIIKLKYMKAIFKLVLSITNSKASLRLSLCKYKYYYNHGINFHGYNYRAWLPTRSAITDTLSIISWQSYV